MVDVAIPATVRLAERADLDHRWTYAYFDRDGELLYVGITVDPFNRAVSHRGSSLWWPFVSSASVWLLPEWDAPRLERELIEIFQPPFNVRMARNGTARSAVEYLARREAWELVDHYIDLSGVQA